MTGRCTPSSSPAQEVDVASAIVAWQRTAGRNDLPWQNTRDPYAIWISEVMLQQTQVAAVIPYYQRFLARFPDCATLARAALDDVMQHWSGLGYYSRARNLHAAARIVVERDDGRFPSTAEAIEALPGIGRSTAAAIAVFAFGARQAILDGNVRRVLCRVFGLDGAPEEAAQQRRLWALAESLLPLDGIEAYTQGLMDLGATVCVRRTPKCAACPLAGMCVAYRSGRVAELPRPRARRPLPTRDTMMLIMIHNAQVLLERRPPAGIWGALWCLPEAATDADPEEVCRLRFGARAAALTPLAPIEHGFTHYRLRILPLRIDVDRIEPAAGEVGWVWLPIADAIGAAVPVPVRRILRSS